MSLLFAAGNRPDRAKVENALAIGSDLTTSARISLRPDEREGWLELLSSGLTYDLTGLVPASGGPKIAAAQCFGFDGQKGFATHEAIALRPGPHLEPGAAMLPVVRIMAGIAAGLAASLAARAVCWHPAQTWMEPGYFQRVVAAWLAGGAFPALGLTSIHPAAGGGVETGGLAHFIGKELQVPARAGETQADTVKLAVRLIDYLVRWGGVSEPLSLEGPDGEPLRIEPSFDTRPLRVSRGAA